MKKIITKILKFGTIWSTILLIFMVLIQIYSRFFLAQSPSWTEEASRVCFIYAISFASGLALKDNFYVYLDYFFQQFNSKIKKIIAIIISIISIILFLIFTFFSFHFVLLGHIEKSPSLKINMSYIFMSMIIMGASISYFSIIELIKKIKELNK